MSEQAEAVHENGDSDRYSAARFVASNERLRLLAWAAAPERLTYLTILEAFADAQARYAVQLRPQELLTALDIEDDRNAVVAVNHESVLRYLDALVAWGVLDRAWDSALVGSIDEYRRRRPVYRFSELGERAYRGVRELLEARSGEGRLQGFVLRSIADDLEALRAAVLTDDGDLALVLLNRVDVVLRQLAERAAQFYVLVEALSQEADVNAERFIELKDLLLSHLYGFLDELDRWSPVIAAHVRELQRDHLDAMLSLVVATDQAVFLTPAQQHEEWRSRWDGLVGWFDASHGPTTVAELDRRTTTAVRELTGLLRRLLEAWGRGASRATDMVELARWFWALEELPDGAPAAHALFGATFGLAGCRHLSRSADEFGDVTPSTSWVDAPRVAVPKSLRATGRRSSPGNSASVPDNRAAREQLRRIRLDQVEREQAAVDLLALAGLEGRVLSNPEFEVLMRLIDTTLVEGVPVSGVVATASERQLMVTLTESDSDTIVAVESGQMTLHGVRIEVAAR